MIRHRHLRKKEVNYCVRQASYAHLYEDRARLTILITLIMKGVIT